MGMASNAIQQRLLENLSLDLPTAVKQVHALEMAQLHSTSYASETNTTVAALIDDQAKPEMDPNSFLIEMSDSPNPTGIVPDTLPQSTSASMVGAVVAAASPALQSVYRTVLPVRLNGGEALDGLVDTGAFKSFLDAKVTKAMNSVTCSSAVSGRVYPEFYLYLMDDCVAPIVLGHDFLQLHRQVSVDFGGTLPPLELNIQSPCALIEAQIEPPAIFDNLTVYCHPLQVKSRGYSKEDSKFIRKEVKRLLEEGIITPSRSSWRAQVVVFDQCDKKRLVIDYSQTINRFTNQIA
ncbi:uncharacterized protein [Palaemon carinicauda]|uniref:uncharacterized protein n=1 Tax=Palaemon carinicauda TaxID=392227 RepID=UPI0035B610C6